VKLTRPVVRETAERDHRTGKPLIIRLEEGGHLIRMKVKGERRWYTVRLAEVWFLGAKNRAAELRLEKAAKQTEKRRLAGKGVS
jgi:hypothetical protein